MRVRQGIVKQQAVQISPCHPERSEGSLPQNAEILRCAQNDKRTNYSLTAPRPGRYLPTTAADQSSGRRSSV